LLIDTHIEVWTIDPKFPFKHPENPNAKPNIAAPVENQIDQMKEFGIKYGVLITPRYFGWDNSYTEYALRKAPGMFVAHGLLNPHDPKAPATLRYWIQEKGFQGMRFSPIYHPKVAWLNDKSQYPIWKEAERLEAVFNFYILPHQMPQLADMAGRFPGVKIVIDHLGKPDLKSADPWPEFRKMFALKKFRQVWISASEPYELSISHKFPYREVIPFYQATYDEFGASNLIWGTGYPRPRWELPMDQELEFVDNFLDFMTPADRLKMLGKNALEIWKFPKV